MKHTLEQANNYIKNNKDKVNPKHRHRFHLMPEIGWMNDPNGFIFFERVLPLILSILPL